MDTLFQSNHVSVVGHMASKITFSHENYGEKFYTFILEVERTSGTKDSLPVIISEHLINNDYTYDNNPVCVIGQIRSYNLSDGDKKHLVLSIFAFDFYNTDEVQSMNSIFLDGFLCKEPVYRTTPAGRHITDLLVAVNRQCGKSDYIPCICWGRNAIFASNMPVGTHITIDGRMQSREYTKQLNDTTETRTAYEVSISKIEHLQEGEYE